MRVAILAGLFLAPVAAILLWSSSPAAAIGVIALSHALVLYPTLRPNVQWLGPVFTSFNTTEREVWLTIDDGPSDDTTGLLDLFESRGVKVTFFVIGKRAEERPELLREMIRRGHSVANHSYSHPSATFWCLPPAHIKQEIEACNRVLQSITGNAPSMFRAPVGMKNPAVHAVLGRHAMRLIGWTARAFDTKTDNIDLIARRVMRGTTPGAIVLMHEGRAWSLKSVTRVVDDLLRENYRFVVPGADRVKTKR